MSSTLIRDALGPSGLFLEGTEQYSATFPVNTYYGFNVTKSENEPVDQIHGFIAARRIQERNYAECGNSGEYFPFIAGLFEVLNVTNPSDLNRIVELNGQKEQRKKALFERIMGAFGLQGTVLITKDLWSDPDYWDILAETLEMPQFSKGNLRRDTLKWYNSPEMLDEVLKVEDMAASGLMSIPEKVLKKIRNWPAAIIYTPVEVAEAKYLAQKKQVRCKIGHMDETVYDKYIIPFADVIHLRQPVDFKGSRLKPRGVTPYIHKLRERDPKVRVFFDDTPETISERTIEYAAEEYVFSIIPNGGEVLNPYLDKCVLAVESARAMSRAPIEIAGVMVENGSDLIRAVYTQKLTIKTLAEIMPTMVYSHLVEPFQG